MYRLNKFMVRPWIISYASPHMNVEVCVIYILCTCGYKARYIVGKKSASFDNNTLILKSTIIPMYPGGGNSGGFGYPPDTGGYPPPSQQPGGFNVAPGKIKFVLCHKNLPFRNID